MGTHVVCFPRAVWLPSFENRPFAPDPMLLQQALVSRKTPLDGRLEILAAVADRLSDAGPLTVLVGGLEAEGRVEEMACTCAKAGGAHTHHFLSSPALMTLAPGANVSLTIDLDEGIVQVDLDP